MEYGFCVYTNPNANVCSIIDVYHGYAEGGLCSPTLRISRWCHVSTLIPGRGARYFMCASRTSDKDRS